MMSACTKRLDVRLTPFGLALFTCLVLRSTAAQSPPDRTTRSLHVPDGCEVSLFAAEPMVRNPTSIVVDSRGRVWITEGRNYRLWRTEKPGQIERQPEGDQVKILEDTDGDGRADRVTVFAQGIFPAPMGLAVEEIWREGSYAGCRVYVGNSPRLLLLEDTDGDDRADRSSALLEGFRGIDSDHGLHGLTLALDGRLYFTVGDARYGADNVKAETPTFDVTDRSGRRLQSARYGTVCRVRPDGKQMEVLAYRLRNDYETCVDSFGNVFVSDNDDDGHFGCRINWILNGGNYGYRMPGTRLHNAEDLPGVVPKIAGTGNGSPAGLLVYEGTMLPKPFQGAILEADAGTRQINAFPLHRRGAAIRTRYEVLLRGDDDWFRPVDLDTAPDGSLFIADWYDAGVGGNRVTDQTTGRIYRVARKGMSYRVPKWNRRSPVDAAAALNSPSRTTRFAARRILLQANRVDVLEQLARLLHHGRPAERARALAVLSSMSNEGRRLVETALGDPSPAVRETALRLLAEDATRNALLLRPGATPPTPPILHSWEAGTALVDDPDPGVRRELILALRHVPTEKCDRLLRRLTLAWDGRDRYYLEALRLALHDRESDFVESLFADLSRAALAAPPAKAATVAVPPYFPTTDNTAYLRPDDSLPPATPLGRLAGIAWSLGRVEGLSVLPRHYGRSIHPDEREAIERGLEQIASPDAATPLLDRWASRGDSTDVSEQRRILHKLTRAARHHWSFLKTDRRFLKLLGNALQQEALQADALATIADLRLATFQPHLLDWLDDQSMQAERRGRTLETLVRLGSRKAVDRARHWLDTGTAGRLDPVLATYAVRALAADPSSNGRLMKLVTDAEQPLSIRREALQPLLQRPGTAQRVLQSIERGELDEPLAKEVTLQLANHPRRTIREQARQQLAHRYGRSQRLIDFERILSLDGDAKRGETVFFTRGTTSCGKCHRAAGAGASIGPDLSAIGTKYGRRELLSHIVFPNQAINYNYATTSLMLEDGRVLNGMIVQRDGDQLLLATAQGQTVRIDRGTVEAEKRQPTSLMPEGLCDSLNDQEIADLLAYLATLRRPVVNLGEAWLAGPVAFDDSNSSRATGAPRAVRIEAGQGGYFSLPPVESPGNRWRLHWRIGSAFPQRFDLIVETPGTPAARIGTDELEWKRGPSSGMRVYRASALARAGEQPLVIDIAPPVGKECPVHVTLVPTRPMRIVMRPASPQRANPPASDTSPPNRNSEP